MHAKHEKRLPCPLQEELGVDPSDESRAYITFLVPKDREQALPAFLQHLDQQRQQVRGGVLVAGEGKGV